MIRSFALMAAAAAMAATPVAAQAAPPRVAAPVSAESESLGGSPVLIPIALANYETLQHQILPGEQLPVSLLANTTRMGANSGAAVPAAPE